MIIREINDQYPEFAEAREPIKGAHHHKKLILPSGLLMSIAGLAVILGAASVKEKPLPPPPVERRRPSCTSRFPWRESPASTYRSA